MRIVRGTCHHDCPDSCGWEVTVDGGVAVSLRGSADHPMARGELCPKVNHVIDRTYHPDRLRTPLKRFGKVEELAGAAVFLASDAASFVTGSVLFVDGGWTAADGRFSPPGM